jgi:hypothetical protein
VSPATLVFEDVARLEGDLGLWNGGQSLFSIERGECEHDGRTWWTLGSAIRGDAADLRVLAHGYVQYLRSRPVHLQGDRLTIAERGGVSFDQRGFEVTGL